MIVVLMGVSGCGKTTVGTLLAERLGVPFLEGDDFHPEENVRKMRSGRPLVDEDRWPWLETLARRLSEAAESGGAVVACSALKESYREVLRAGAPGQVVFVYLKGSRETVQQRIERREDHFMPPDLLDSQFETLEEPAGEIVVPIDGTPAQICEVIVKALGERDHDALR